MYVRTFEYALIDSAHKVHTKKICLKTKEHGRFANCLANVKRALFDKANHEAMAT